MDISDFDKDQLAAYAKKEFKTNLDMRKGLEKLREQVKLLQVNPNIAPAYVPTVSDPTHILNVRTGLVFLWTPLGEKFLGADGARCNEAGERV
jgi:hypothetical protein